MLEKLAFNLLRLAEINPGKAIRIPQQNARPTAIEMLIKVN
ncbi:1470_t:CDS:2 [Paraglomus brasilianum]|uniref:1470_t:CDS:1 n=1 Tax=Paraglomus brasilianum TaxID=144538 RepID=A0A9N8VNI1_9GLOM|nr:1470_t:CDS:2 [Paraglomus brasilianum]